MAKGEIYGINGPVIEVIGSKDFMMLEMVSIGNENLIGEVIAVDTDKVIVQAYEETAGLKTGEPVTGQTMPMSSMLGPGIIGNIFDGIQRPLKVIADKTGAFIKRGIKTEPLDKEAKWKVTFKVKEGDMLNSGDIFAVCPETELIEHRFMVPNNISGRVTYIAGDGEYSTEDILIKLTGKNGTEAALTMVQSWPIRRARPYKQRKPVALPLITGQRIIDTVFPVAKGGAAAVPGGFGTGKTMTQHQLAKWADADIVVYVGCGERGNEMTQVLEEFSRLIDPKTQRPLLERTVLIANTSNMPVAAREASIYTGITIAEYYRDMGYHVAIMADSTSRWAEALREISGRLEEMPAEEGFPAYLSSRLSEFYERAGYVVNNNQSEGSVTIIGAVSPQGGDFSEPVTQNTKRFVRSFWALDKSLAYQRHYPAIQWLSSYSEYTDDLADFYKTNIAPDFLEVRGEIMNLLRQESSLMEIVKLIGADVLPDEQKLVLAASRVIRLGFLQQNAYHEFDTYVSLKKQYKMARAIQRLYNKSKEVVLQAIPIGQIIETGIFEEVIKMKYNISNSDLTAFDKLDIKIDTACEGVLKSNGFLV